MRTEKQRQASRLNAQKSTGPRTPEGKAISSKNAYKLGISISDAAFYQNPDSRRQLNQLLADYERHYRPCTPFERDALEEIALCRVRLARLHRIEEGLYAEGHERAFVTQTANGPNNATVRRFDQSLYPAHERATVAQMHLAAAWSITQETFETLTRQEARLSLRLRRAQQRFEELLKNRAIHESEPESQDEPEIPEVKIEAKPDLTPLAPTPEPIQPPTPGHPAANEADEKEAA